jgi:hypothetical protein
MSDIEITPGIEQYDTLADCKRSNSFRGDTLSNLTIIDNPLVVISGGGVASPAIRENMPPICAL